MLCLNFKTNTIMDIPVTFQSYRLARAEKHGGHTPPVCGVINLRSCLTLSSDF